ncbi:MAG: glycosyltransferase family 4 protein [Deltaproteobacteria bacterium]|nr:glycosyltransferase family 4 protein [Deltaproteobacteria bacterium]
MLTDVLYPDTVGGSGRVAYHLSHELSRKGHDVHITTRDTTRSLASVRNLDAGITIHRFKRPGGESLLPSVSEIGRSSVLVRHLRRDMNFDVAVIHQTLPAIGPILCGSAKGLPLMYVFHSPWHEEYLIKKAGYAGKLRPLDGSIAFFMKWAEKRMVLRASRTVVLSRYMFEKLFELHRPRKDKISVIPGGVDLRRFQAPGQGKDFLKKALGLPVDRKLLLTVRNLVPRMGIANLIDAVHQSRILRDQVFLMIGGEGPLKARFESMTEEYRLQECVRILGHIPEKDLPGLYQAADFFVLPTRELEGFGLVILEAMASGTPVLGTPVGAIPEIIRPFDGRLLFEGTGWQEMRTKLEEVLIHAELYRFDPQSCRRYVEENYSWKKMATAFEQEMIRMVNP